MVQTSFHQAKITEPSCQEVSILLSEDVHAAQVGRLPQAISVLKKRPKSGKVLVGHGSIPIIYIILHICISYFIYNILYSFLYIIISYHIISYYIISYHIISYHIISYHITYILYMYVYSLVSYQHCVH